MKKRTMLLHYSLLFLCLLHVYSCIKLPPDFEPADAHNVYTGCRIKKITTYDLFSHQLFPYVKVFSYNKNNDPVSIVNNGDGDATFKYDHRNRMTQYINGYSGTGFELLHRYGYSQERITTDTVYALGSLDAEGNPGNYFEKRVAYLQYDIFGRVMQDSMVFLHAEGNFVVVTNYHYDHAGNLIYDQDGVARIIPYDNKLNPHRTNKIWMFIDRDYSVNNTGHAATYNMAGLPLRYLPGPGVYGFRFAGRNVSDSSQLEYDCR